MAHPIIDSNTETILCMYVEKNQVIVISYHNALSTQTNSFIGTLVHWKLRWSELEFFTFFQVRTKQQAV